MIITIDTEKDKPEDIRRFLSELFMAEIKAEPKQLSEPDRTDKVKFPKRYGKAKETTLQIIDYIGTGSVREILKYTDMPEETIRASLSKLKKEKLVDTTTTYPKKYYRRGHNPELNEHLKNAIGKKVSNF